MSAAFTSIMFALQPSIDGSGTPFDPDSIRQATQQAQLPPSLEGDFRSVNAAAQLAAGHSAVEAGTILASPDVTKATANITSWLHANCK